MEHAFDIKFDDLGIEKKEEIRGSVETMVRADTDLMGDFMIEVNADIQERAVEGYSALPDHVESLLDLMVIDKIEEIIKAKFSGKGVINE